MLALDAYEASVCDGCGGYLPETTAAEADEGYTVGTPIRCHRCTAIAQKAEAYGETKHSHALRFPARRKPSRGGPL